MSKIEDFRKQFWNALKIQMLKNGRCVEDGGREDLVLREFVKNIENNKMDIEAKKNDN